MHTRTPIFVSFGFIFTGIFLIVSGWYESRFAGKESIGWKQAVGSGIGQALAVLPGFSRSGLTIASGRLMGLSAKRATEFAFMLGAPALSGALIFTLSTGSSDLATIGKIQIIVGFACSLASSLLAIHFLIRTIKRYGMWIWSLYLFLAASLIIADEMMPFVEALPKIGVAMDLRILAGTLFIALFLEAIPVTSAFVPGFTTMIAVIAIIGDDPWALAAFIPIGTMGLILGNLLGYIPARQASVKVRWSESADQKLFKAHKFFRKWGILAVFFGGWWGPIRPFISIAAGLSNMRPTRYIVTMALGSLTWVTLVLLAVSSIVQLF
jgi:membrane protein DedA with SNARE-associated domain